MNTIFINPRTKLLHGGWRAAIFLLLSPFALEIVNALLRTDEQEPSGTLIVGVAAIIYYVILVAWVLAASWLFLKYFEQLKLSSLGFAFYGRVGTELLAGCAISVLMIVAVVALQVIGGGTRLLLNPMFWKSAAGVRSIDFTGVAIIAKGAILTLVFISLAAAFEELLFRGYAFQTLLRDGISPVVPIILLSLIFGLAHWSNPSRTIFSTTNTMLAGVWLSVAYLKTRSLWFPTALHLAWNWTMGFIFGLPVSGLKLAQHPIFLSTSEAPLWLTGGSYGCEGGAPTTLILVVATIIIWKVKFLCVAPEMEAALQKNSPDHQATIKLGLVE